MIAPPFALIRVNILYKKGLYNILWWVRLGAKPQNVGQKDSNKSMMELPKKFSMLYYIVEETYYLLSIDDINVDYNNKGVVHSQSKVLWC